MNVSKPRPSDHPLLIVFVVGGITPTEVKQMKDAVSKSNVQVWSNAHLNSAFFSFYNKTSTLLRHRSQRIRQGGRYLKHNGLGNVCEGADALLIP